MIRVEDVGFRVQGSGRSRVPFRVPSGCKHGIHKG